MPTVIDTAKAERRTLRFSAPADLRAEIDRIVAADRATTLRRTGNWSTGQIFGHLAAWIDYNYDGYPPELRPPWFIKLILRFRKNRFLKGPLPAGVKIPRIKGGTTATDPLSLDEGHARLIKSWDRLEKAPPSTPNIAFGPLPHSDWIRLHLRHAELHLGFLDPFGSPIEPPR